MKMAAGRVCDCASRSRRRGAGRGKESAPSLSRPIARSLNLSLSPPTSGNWSRFPAQGFLTALEKDEIIEINGLTENKMAGNLHVRNLDDDLIARLKCCAARHGRSTEAEHREILRLALAGDIETSFETLAADLRQLTRRRKQTPSEDLLREGRKQR